MTSTMLYQGAVKLDFEPGKHTYTVSDERGTRNVPSVTQILSIVDKSGPLTQWAANSTVEYLKAAIRPGARYDEIQLASILDQARFNFRSVSKGAKAVGQLAHEWIEGYNRNLISAVKSPAQPLPINEQAKAAIQAATSWITQHFKPLSMEHKIYSRESEFAGTLDVVGEVDGQVAIVDWKAAGAIYREFRLQTAAYAAAWSEMNGDFGIPDRWVIRLDKDSGEFEAVKFSREEYRRDLQGFLAAKQLHLTLEAIKTPKPAKPQPAPQPKPQWPATPPPKPIPPRGPMAPAAQAVNGGLINAPLGRIEGFAGNEKGRTPVQNATPTTYPAAQSYTPRRPYDKPKSSPMIRWCQMQDALILVGGGTYKLMGALFELGGRRSRDKNADGTPGPWVWQLHANQFGKLQCACNEEGIRLIRADSGRAA